MPAEGLAQLHAIYRDVHSDRQIQNIAFAQQALRILGLVPPAHDAPLPPPTWLVDWQGADRGKQGAVEMGRPGTARPHVICRLQRRLHSRHG